jgi:hypothetical protein
MNTLKNLFFMVLLSGLFFASCTSDEDFHTATINITAPTGDITVEPGAPITLAGTIEDTDGLSSLDITSTVGISASESISGTTHTFSYNAAAPGADGDYSISIKVTNSAGNITTAKRNVKVATADPCASDDMTIVVVTVPANTPADAKIEMVGGFNGWPGELDANYVMTRRNDGTYCLPVLIDAGAEFKFRRDGSWDKVEKDAAGGEIGNRSFKVDIGNEVSYTVEKWADL